MGKHPDSPSKDVQVCLNHGRLFEKHAIATLVGAIMPALMPPCYSYFEVGSLIHNIDKQDQFLVVSPDGMLQCIHSNETCDFHNISHHG